MVRFELTTFGLLDIHVTNHPTFLFALCNHLSYVTIRNVTYQSKWSVSNWHRIIWNALKPGWLPNHSRLTSKLEVYFRNCLQNQPLGTTRNECYYHQVGFRCGWVWWMGVVDGRLWMVACVQYQSWILVPMTLDQKIAVFNPNCGHWFKYIPNLFCKNNSKAILL